MKKILLISAITVIIGVVFAVNPYWFRFMWGVQILLLPLTAGILMSFIQKENRSYRFLPKLIIGSLLIGFAGTFLVQTVDYLMNRNAYNESLNPLSMIIDLSLIMSVICIFGGLIGIAIRGTTILLTKK